MKCEYCERAFEKGPVKKVLRGKAHTFCSESCFNLYFYKYPKFDMERMYETYTVPVSVPDIDALFDDDGEK